MNLVVQTSSHTRANAKLCVMCICRYERTANDMLAKSTIAGQEGVITYLANAAALQQFEQTALAYVLMSEAGRTMGAAGLAAAAESLLEGKFEVGAFLLFLCFLVSLQKNIGSNTLYESRRVCNL